MSATLAPSETPAAATESPPAAEAEADADELVWQGGLSALELAEVRCALLNGPLKAATANARAEKPGTAERHRRVWRACFLVALLEKLRPAHGDVAALPKVEG